MILTIAQWELDSEFRPTFSAIRSSHGSSVNPDNCVNEGKSKSVTSRCPPFHSSLEEMMSNFRIEARPIVFHRKYAHITC